jgi:hypothetical protein
VALRRDAAQLRSDRGVDERDSDLQATALINREW